MLKSMDMTYVDKILMGATYVDKMNPVMMNPDKILMDLMLLE